MTQTLADRIRSTLAPVPGIAEIRMFGGLCFTLNGHMLVGAMREGDMLVRVGKARDAEALADPAARRLSAGSREMAGYVAVRAGALDDAALAVWIGRAMAEVSPMPPKVKGETKTARPRRAASTS